MSVQRSPRTCPACEHHFIPWSVWRISIYTPIPCPNCGAKLIRRRDLQFFVLPVSLGLCLFAAGYFFRLSLRAFIVYGLLALFLLSPVDAVTVRLVQAGRWRGWLRGGFGREDAMTRFDPLLLALAFIFFSLAIYYFVHS
jgi:predicted RNA-binding Zn-ribbon protein involved in translation (DUF1610 family)